MRLSRSMCCLALAGLAGIAAISWTSARAAEEAKKPTIKEIMKEANKGDDCLMKKVQSGKATKEEKDRLLNLYTIMASWDPPKGDKESWHQKTAALVKAVKAYNAGEADGPAALKAAADCKACHSVHKPK